MKDSNPPYAGTSAVSLIAITAGTVSAAWLIMFVGLFLTMMSIGSTSQTTASLRSHVYQDHALQMVSAQNFVRDGSPHTKAYQKGRVMDALLREERMQSMTPSGHPDQAMAHTPHVYAISTIVKFSSHQIHLVQI